LLNKIYQEVDEERYWVRAEANGSEQKARGNAQAEIEFFLSEENGVTRLTVDTDLQLAGSIAQYARGGTFIESTAQVLMDQFAENLRASIIENERAETAGTETGEDSPVQPRVAAEISVVRLLLHGFKAACRSWLRKLFGSRK